MYLVIVVVSTFLLCWCLQGQRSTIRRNGKRLPRPPGTLPLAGNGIWFLQPRHRLLEWFSQVERKAGLQTYEISVPSLPPAIVINDPSNVEHVFKCNDIFIKGEFFKARSRDLFGDGIINADGPLWRTQRKAGLRFFSSAQLQTFIDTLLPLCLSTTFASLDTHITDGTPCDLQAVFLELTTRLMGKMAYDMDMPSSLPFSHAFDYASGCVGERFQNPFWKINEWVFGGKMQKAVKEVKKFGDEIVLAAVQRREAVLRSEVPKTDEHQHRNLIDSLLDHIPSQRTVADAAMNYLSAGRDTTAQSLTWTFYLLMRNPRCIPSVLSELSALRRGSTAPLPGSPGDSIPSYTALTASPNPFTYTTATFNEALRLYPPVPIELKECTSATTFPDGTSLPAGAIVMWIPWAMNRSHHIWGVDADDYRPERWLVSVDENEAKEAFTDDAKRNGNGGNKTSSLRRKETKTQVVTRPAHEFPVFNGGARTCLGRRMAELLGVAVIAGVLREGYEFEEVETLDDAEGREREGRGKRIMEEKKSQSSLTLPMEGGLWVKIRKKERNTEDEAKEQRA